MINKKRLPLFVLTNFLSFYIALIGKQYFYENKILLGFAFTFLGGILFIASYVYIYKYKN